MKLRRPLQYCIHSRPKVVIGNPMPMHPAWIIALPGSSSNPRPQLAILSCIQKTIAGCRAGPGPTTCPSGLGPAAPPSSLPRSSVSNARHAIRAVRRASAHHDAPFYLSPLLAWLHFFSKVEAPIQKEPSEVPEIK